MHAVSSPMHAAPPPPPPPTRRSPVGNQAAPVAGAAAPPRLRRPPTGGCQTPGRRPAGRPWADPVDTRPPPPPAVGGGGGEERGEGGGWLPVRAFPAARPPTRRGLAGELRARPKWAPPGPPPHFLPPHFFSSFYAGPRLSGGGYCRVGGGEGGGRGRGPEAGSGGGGARSRTALARPPASAPPPRRVRPGADGGPPGCAACLTLPLPCPFSFLSLWCLRPNDHPLAVGRGGVRGKRHVTRSGWRLGGCVLVGADTHTVTGWWSKGAGKGTE